MCRRHCTALDHVRVTRTGCSWENRSGSAAEHIITTHLACKEIGCKDLSCAVVIKTKEATQDVDLWGKNKHTYVSAGGDKLIYFITHFTTELHIQLCNSLAVVQGTTRGNCRECFGNICDSTKLLNPETFMTLCKQLSNDLLHSLMALFFVSFCFQTNMDKRPIKRNLRKGHSRRSQPCQVHLLLLFQVCVNERVTNTLTPTLNAVQVLLLPAHARFFFFYRRAILLVQT